MRRRSHPRIEKRFRAKKKAWAWFEAQPKGYRQNTIRWVMTAKKEETRERRLATLIEDSAAGRRIAPLGDEGRAVAGSRPATAQLPSDRRPAPTHLVGREVPGSSSEEVGSRRVPREDAEGEGSVVSVRHLHPSEDDVTVVRDPDAPRIADDALHDLVADRDLPVILDEDQPPMAVPLHGPRATTTRVCATAGVAASKLTAATATIAVLIARHPFLIPSPFVVCPVRSGHAATVSAGRSAAQ